MGLASWQSGGQANHFHPELSVEQKAKQFRVLYRVAVTLKHEIHFATENCFIVLPKVFLDLKINAISYNIPLAWNSDDGFLTYFTAHDVVATGNPPNTFVVWVA